MNKLENIKRLAIELNTDSKFWGISIEGENIVIATIGCEPPFVSSYSLLVNTPKEIAIKIVADDAKARDSEFEAWESLANSYERSFEHPY